MVIYAGKCVIGYHCYANYSRFFPVLTKLLHRQFSKTATLVGQSYVVAVVKVAVVVFSILVMRCGTCICASGMCERMFSICACATNI